MYRPPFLTMRGDPESPLQVSFPALNKMITIKILLLMIFWGFSPTPSPKITWACKSLNCAEIPQHFHPDTSRPDPAATWSSNNQHWVHFDKSKTDFNNGDELSYIFKLSDIVTSTVCQSSRSRIWPCTFFEFRRKVSKTYFISGWKIPDLKYEFLGIFS